jgi:hypothetical protein
MKTKTVFISGKVSGLSPLQAYQNFKSAEMRLVDDKETYKVINPISICKSTYPWWLCMTICLYNLIFKADYIYMLDNWKDSRGAKIEHAVARKIGKEVIYE